MAIPDQSERERIARVAAEYGPLLDGFIKEASPFATRESLVSQMDILPIIFNDVLAGIVGLRVEPTGAGKVAIIKLLYLDPAHRAKRLDVVLEQLARRFREEGITHIEGWSRPGVANWLQNQVGLTPKLWVFHEEINGFIEKVAASRAKG